MKTYYHGTEAKNLPSILEHGLDPRFSQRDDEPKPYIFLSTLRGAEAFAPGGDVCTSTEKGVILAVTVPRDVSKHFCYNRGEFVRTPIVIPPKYIAIHEYTNL